MDNDERRRWVSDQIRNPPNARECIFDAEARFWRGKHGRPVMRDSEGRTVHVARMLLGLEHGDGLIARHRCHNPLCINIRHLAVGTPADNAQDMVEARRSFRPPWKGTKGVLRAGRNPQQPHPAIEIR